MGTDCGQFGVLNEFERIWSSGVLSNWDIIVVNFFSMLIKNDVLKDCSESDSVVDFRLFFFAEVDAFGVAASFDVEDSVVGPDMFVVTDQISIVGSWKGGFSSSGESEEEADVVGISFADVAAGVERKVTFLGHEIVHDGEHTLLHLTCVLTAEDYHLSLLEVQTDSNVSHNVGNVLVSHELSSVEDVVVGSVGEVSLELSGSGSDEHVGHKESVVGTSAHDSDSDSVFGAPSSIAINNINFSSGVEIALGQSWKDLERLSSDWFVDVSPSNILLTDRVVNNGFGRRRAAESINIYPVFDPEKATKAPLLAMSLCLVKGSAGVYCMPWT